MKRNAIVLTLSLLCCANVYAGCSLNGQDYPTGSVKNGYTCGSDGYWRKS